MLLLPEQLHDKVQHEQEQEEEENKKFLILRNSKSKESARERERSLKTLPKRSINLIKMQTPFCVYTHSMVHNANIYDGISFYGCFFFGHENKLISNFLCSRSTIVLIMSLSSLLLYISLLLFCVCVCNFLYISSI